VRSLSVQAEVVSRVEAAGGAILAVDVGALSHDSAGSWLSGTMLGAVAEYARRVTAERTQDSKRRAVARGVAPYPNIPPGYRRRDDGSIEPDPHTAATIADAFRLRAKGSTVRAVREHLRANGIERSYHGTQSMLTSRVYLGELSFGALRNPASHEAIVDATVWTTVQRMSSPRGRLAKSERLLARLGILRCGTCGARMVVGSANHGSYALYRCPPVSDCPQRVTISADIAERVVTEGVQELLAGKGGTASLSDGVADAERDLAAAERELDAAVEAFTGLEDVSTAREKLTGLREARDVARDRLADISATVLPAIKLTASDWNELTLGERRDLIRAVVDRAVVVPGRGANRVTVEPRVAAALQHDQERAALRSALRATNAPSRSLSVVMPERLDTVRIRVNRVEFTLTWAARDALLSRLQHVNESVGLRQGFSAVGATRPVELNAAQTAKIIAVLEEWSWEEGDPPMPEELTVLRAALADDLNNPAQGD
jgi:hypothetical protein